MNPFCLPRSGIVLVLALLILSPPSARGEEGADAQRDGVRALILPRLETTLAAEIPGRIESVAVDMGDRFAAGKNLVVFDCRMHRAELEMARADLEERRKTLEVNQKLSALKSVSSLDMATSQSRLERAEADAALKKAQVEKCVLKAPLAGRVIKRHASPHQYVTPGQPLLDIIDDSRLIVQLFIPSSWIVSIKNGTPFDLRVDETGRSYKARIKTMGARVDPVSQSIEARGEIEGSHPELLPGMSGFAIFPRP